MERWVQKMGRTSSLLRAGSADMRKGSGFLISDHSPIFFRMAVEATSRFSV